MSLLSRFRNLWRQDALDREFDEELSFHIEQLTEKYVKQGLSREQASRRARQHAGNTINAKEDMREARIMMWLDTLTRDILYGARMLRRQPGTTLLAVLTLSLGIGANTVIYSLLHAALIRPLPFPSPQQLVSVIDEFKTDNAQTTPTIPEVLDVRAATKTLDLVSFFDMRDAQINGGTEPARAVSARIEADFLRTLGAQPALGRLFSQRDHESGHDRVVILSHAFWRSNFGGDPSIINRDIIVNGAPYSVVGVLPEGWNFDYFTPEPIELYVPFPMTPDYTARTNPYAQLRRVVAIARMKDGVTLAQADAELDTIGQRQKADYPNLYKRGQDGQDLGFTISAQPLREMVVGRGAQSAVWILFAAVGVVLLIACANTAQFLMARAIERQPEVVIRAALGAGASRLLQQFLTEAFVLAGIATVLGLLQASALTNILRALLASPSPLIVHLGLNTPVIVFTLIVTLIVTIVSGLFPAVHLIRRRFVAGDPARLTGVTRARARHFMIAAQVAASVVLLVSAVLIANGLRQLQNAPRGYDSSNVTIMRLRAAAPVDRRGTGIGYQQYLQALAAVPGPSAIAIADGPVQGFASVEFSIVGRGDDAATLAQQRAAWRIVSPDYFKVLSIPVRAGRVFTDDDHFDAPQAVVVNETMARRFWPNQNPIGQQIKSGSGPRLRIATIIGVVGDVRPEQRLDVPPQIYVSYLQQSEPNATLLIRTANGTPVPLDAIKQAIRTVVAEQPVFGIQRLDDVLQRSNNTRRLMTRLLSSFAILAVALALLGVYTVVSYLTARRTKEVALRRAIGATPQDVMRLLGAPTLRWTITGIAFGFLGGAWLVRFMTTIASALDMPQSVLRLDAPTIAMTTIAYLIVVCVAVLAPAARALRIQPAIILRAE